jgi:hypothetical protein
MMGAYDPLDPDNDVFRPPAIPTLVGCLHCGQEYDSYLIEWRVDRDAKGRSRGFWCCPTPGCGGMGFGFDILPVDPTYRDERGGWIGDDDEETESDLEDEFLTDSASDAPSADAKPRDPPDEDEALPW